MRGRGGYPAAFDNRSRPIEGRRRNSPPPRQYLERGRGAPRGRGGRGRWSISQSGKHLTEMFQVEKRREKERENSLLYTLFGLSVSLKAILNQLNINTKLSTFFGGD